MTHASSLPQTDVSHALHGHVSKLLLNKRERNSLLQDKLRLMRVSRWLTTHHKLVIEKEHGLNLIDCFPSVQRDLHAQIELVQTSIIIAVQLIGLSGG